MRTYATGILKFKIIDVIRKRGREVHIEPLDEQTMDDARDALFAKGGHWAEPPPVWQDPEKALQQSQFFGVLQTSVDHLPAKIGRVFMMLRISVHRDRPFRHRDRRIRERDRPFR